MVESVIIASGSTKLLGILNTPKESKSMILFAHSSGSGRLSSRNRLVADYFNKAGFSTLLMDLLTETSC